MYRIELQKIESIILRTSLRKKPLKLPWKWAKRKQRQNELCGSQGACKKIGLLNKVAKIIMEEKNIFFSEQRNIYIVKCVPCWLSLKQKLGYPYYVGELILGDEGERGK